MWKQLGQLFYSLQTPAGCAVPTVGTTVLHWFYFLGQLFYSCVKLRSFRSTDFVRPYAFRTRRAAFEKTLSIIQTVFANSRNHLLPREFSAS